MDVDVEVIDAVDEVIVAIKNTRIEDQRRITPLQRRIYIVNRLFHSRYGLISSPMYVILLILRVVK